MKNVFVLLQLLGIALFFVYFPIGLLFGIILVVFGGVGYREESKRIICPSCKEKIIKDAIKCRYCGIELKLSNKTEKIRS